MGRRLHRPPRWPVLRGAASRIRSRPSRCPRTRQRLNRRKIRRSSPPSLHRPLRSRALRLATARTLGRDSARCWGIHSRSTTPSWSRRPRSRMAVPDPLPFASINPRCRRRIASPRKRTGTGFHQPSSRCHPARKRYSRSRKSPPGNRQRSWPETRPGTGSCALGGTKNVPSFATSSVRSCGPSVTRAGPEIDKLAKRSTFDVDPLKYEQAVKTWRYKSGSLLAKVRLIRSLDLPETVILDFLSDDQHALLRSRKGPRNENEVRVRAALQLLNFEPSEADSAPPPAAAAGRRAIPAQTVAPRPAGPGPRPH